MKRILSSSVWSFFFSPKFIIFWMRTQGFLHGLARGVLATAAWRSAGGRRLGRLHALVRSAQHQTESRRSSRQKGNLAVPTFLPAAVVSRVRLRCSVSSKGGRARAPASCRGLEPLFCGCGPRLSLSLLSEILNNLKKSDFFSTSYLEQRGIQVTAGFRTQKTVVHPHSFLG